MANRADCALRKRDLPTRGGVMRNWCPTDFMRDGQINAHPAPQMYHSKHLRTIFRFPKPSDYKLAATVRFIARRNRQRTLSESIRGNIRTL